MSTSDFYKALQNALQVTIETVGKDGPEIQVGEQFKLKITVTNTAPWGPAHPYVQFQNTQVRVSATEFATPVDGINVTLDLEDQDNKPHLLTRGGDSGFVYVTMKATRAILNSTIPGIIPEEVARVSVTTRFDFSSYFRIRKDVVAIEDIVTS